ncbi:hypothetical protein BH09MYX1_BH09MYX1_61300 [soil metagenome]
MGKAANLGRPSALVRAEHGGTPIALDATQKLLLGDALRAGAGLADELEDKVVAYGRFLLSKVFADDTTAALDRKTKNPVWLELVRRAGGPTLRLNRRLVYVALTTAAWDRRIHDAAFRSLDVARKELLLPLGDELRLKAAANHVAKLDLTQTDTRQYVTQLLAEEGKVRQVRITGKGIVSRAMKLRKSFEGATLKRIKTLELEPAERKAALLELARLKEVLAEVVKALNGRG